MLYQIVNAFENYLFWGIAGKPYRANHTDYGGDNPQIPTHQSYTTHLLPAISVLSVAVKYITEQNNDPWVLNQS